MWMWWRTLFQLSHSFSWYWEPLAYEPWFDREGRYTGNDASKTWAALIPILLLPSAKPPLKTLTFSFGGKNGQDLNDHVGGTAMLQMSNCILTAVELLLYLPFTRSAVEMNTKTLENLNFKFDLNLTWIFIWLGRLEMPLITTPSILITPHSLANSNVIATLVDASKRT